MEIFYSPDIAQGGTRLDTIESGHCIKVLRHRKGDIINIVDGAGTLFRCEITDDNPVVWFLPSWNGRRVTAVIHTGSILRWHLQRMQNVLIGLWKRPPKWV